MVAWAGRSAHKGGYGMRHLLLLRHHVHQGAQSKQGQKSLYVDRNVGARRENGAFTAPIMKMSRAGWCLSVSPSATGASGRGTRRWVGSWWLVGPGERADRCHATGYLFWRRRHEGAGEVRARLPAHTLFPRSTQTAAARDSSGILQRRHPNAGVLRFRTCGMWSAGRSPIRTRRANGYYCILQHSAADVGLTGLPGLGVIKCR